MEHQMIAAQVKVQVALQRVQEALKSERGEIGSWLILAAALAIAAGLAGAGLATWIGEKAESITSQ